jgi:hypothetical protein
MAPLLRAAGARQRAPLRLRRLRQCRHRRSLLHLLRSPPRRAALCVVEEVSDLWALAARGFPGSFHVLGGRLSALEGVRPEDLSSDIWIGGSPGRDRRGGSCHERDALGGHHTPITSPSGSKLSRAHSQSLARHRAASPSAASARLSDEGTLAQALRRGAGEHDLEPNGEVRWTYRARAGRAIWRGSRREERGGEG